MHLHQLLNVTSCLNDKFLNVVVSDLKSVQRLHMIKYLHFEDIDLLVNLAFHGLLIIL